MSSLLLSTKTHIPLPRQGGVLRPRLTQRIIQTFEKPGAHVLVSAPAGFGKTTLVSEFAASSQQPIAWLSLDEGDNDPVTFWNYIIKAIQSVHAGLGDSTLALCQSPQPLPPGMIPVSLVNDLVEDGRVLILILDDFHVIDNASIQEEVATLVEHLPESIHLLVSTRVDPPWPLPKMRVRAQLEEIRAHDLRFSTEEADQFLHELAGINLTPHEVKVLDERTEGWAAGLQLAALSLKGRSDVLAFIESLSGVHVYIAEYLVEEVLRQQPDQIQSFLIQTSILKSLTPGLCESVTELPNGLEMLNTLKKSNLFIINLDDQGEWNRYHHLFADLLQARFLKRYSKDEIAGFNQRASRWYLDAGMIQEAIDHALKAEDYQQVECLIEKIALPMILQANIKTVEKWLLAIPHSFVNQSRGILIAFSWLNLLRGTAPQAMVYIEQLRRLFLNLELKTLDSTNLGEWLAIQAEVCIAEGKFEESKELSIEALKVYPSGISPVRSMINISLAKVYQRTYEYEKAVKVFQKIVEYAQQIGDPIFEILGISGQAQMYLKQGKLHQCFRVAMDGINRIESSGKKTPFAATFYGEVGQAYYEWHNFYQAKDYLLRSMQASGKTGYSDPEIYYWLMLSKMSSLEGELSLASAEMEKAVRLAGELPPAMIRENVISQRVWIHLLNDQLETAERLLIAEGFSFDIDIVFPNLQNLIPDSYSTNILFNCGLRLILYRSKNSLNNLSLEKGLVLSAELFTNEIKYQQISLAIETLLLRSQMAWMLKKRELGLQEIRKAVELGEPEGFISIFLEEGQIVAEILGLLNKSQSIKQQTGQYIQKILSAFRDLPQGTEVVTTEISTNQANPDSRLIEPLTRRELEVLSLISLGASNQEIADKLVITLSAVKKHTGNIFGKLNVKNRTTAAAAARKAGLIPGD
jgi:LuxR family maltose regulon positive regulatory protein